MKSILVKIGKTINILKREGIVSGGSRFLTTGFWYLKMMWPMRAGDILFVAGGAAGDSAVYRVHNQAEELSLHGFRCQAVTQDNPFLISSANKFKVFIFQRVIYTSSIAKFIDKIKKNKGDIIFEADDLFFDPKYFGDIEFLKNTNKLEQGLYQNGLGAEILNDPYVRTCVVSTSYLAQKLREKGKNVYVSKNKFSEKELGIAENILENKKKKNDGFTRLGYYSGTFSHNKDFAAIVNVLTAILKKYSQVKLILAGPLDPGNKLNDFKNRVEVLPRVSRAKYYENLYKSDINLYPLEPDNPFCEAKSEIRFIETGILKIPTVAVRNQTFSEAITEGSDGFLASDTNEWVEKISQLIERPELRKSMGEKAREKVLRDYTNRNSHNKEYYSYLQNLIETKRPRQ